MIIWITGCTSGLGRACLDEFVKARHRVVGCGRRSSKVAELAEHYGPTHHLMAVDVSVEAEVEAFCQSGLAAVGAPDLLINNAAVINDPAPLWEISGQDFDHLMAVNVSGTAHVIRHLLPAMMARGRGVIVNLSSGWGRSTSPEVAPYCASKWAIEGLTSALSQELPPGLAAVALNPGIIDTPMLRHTWQEGASAYPTPEEWAKKAAPFLLSLDASHNGQPLTAPA